MALEITASDLSLPPGVASAADLPAYYAAKRRRMYAKRPAAPKSAKVEEPAPSADMPRARNWSFEHRDSLPTSEEIIFACSGFFGIPVQQIRGPRRTMDIVRARHVAIYLAVKLTDERLVDIASAFGREQSAVRQAARNLAPFFELEPDLVATVDYLWTLLDRRPE